MSLQNCYITAAEFDAWYGETITGDNQMLKDAAINSASRAVDDYCGRRFYLDSGVSAKKYTPVKPSEVLPVDDFATTTGLIVVDRTNTLTIDTQFQVEPAGYQGRGLFPYTGLRPLAWWWLQSFYPGQSTITVTAQWGWPSVPDPVKQATFLMAARILKLKDAPLSVAGVSEWGVVRVGANRDFEMLLNNYRRGNMAFGLA